MGLGHPVEYVILQARGRQADGNMSHLPYADGNMSYLPYADGNMSYLPYADGNMSYLPLPTVMSVQGFQCTECECVQEGWTCVRTCIYVYTLRYVQTHNPPFLYTLTLTTPSVMIYVYTLALIAPGYLIDPWQISSCERKLGYFLRRQCVHPIAFSVHTHTAYMRASHISYVGSVSVYTLLHLQCHVSVYTLLHLQCHVYSLLHLECHAFFLMGTAALYRVCSTGLRQTQGSPSFSLFRSYCIQSVIQGEPFYVSSSPCDSVMRYISHVSHTSHMYGIRRYGITGIRYILDLSHTFSPHAYAGRVSDQKRRPHHTHTHTHQEQQNRNCNTLQHIATHGNIQQRVP